MQIKLDENNNAVLDNGKPVYLKDDGSEIAVDVGQLFQTIGAKNTDAKKLREKLEATEAKMKTYLSLGDAAELAELAELGRSVQGKSMIDAGKVEELKAQYNEQYRQQYEAQYAPIKEKADRLEKQIVAEKINNSFANSKFIKDNIAVPVDMMKDTFGRYFKVEENGQIVGYGNDNQPIFSKNIENIGNLATFDEALKYIVDGYAYKESILRGSGNSGSGATGSAVGVTGSKTISRAQFASMSPSEQMSKMTNGYTLLD